MILPTTRWFGIGALLAPFALLALWRADAVLLFIALNFVWVAAWIVDAVRARRIDVPHFPVTRRAPPAFSVGRTAQIEYEWNNPTARALTLLVQEEWPGQLGEEGRERRRLDIPAGEQVVDTVGVRPTARGRIMAGRLHLRVLGPWGLAWFQGRRELPWQFTIFPNLQHTSLRTLPTSAQRQRWAGLRQMRQRGEGRSFESLRQWTEGDDSRAIDWKSTARRGHLMVRQYEAERRQQVMLMIDAGRMLTAEIEGRPRLEYAIDAALALATSAVHHDDDIGLLVFADQVLSFVAPARGRRALQQILNALAMIEGRMVEPHYPAAFAFLAARSRRRALTVLFTDVIDRTASEAILSHAGSLRPRHLPLTVTLRDPGLERLAVSHPSDDNEAFDRAAAEELLGAREVALYDLRRRGVLVLDTLPEQAAEDVVDQYERLKRRAVV